MSTSVQDALNHAASNRDSIMAGFQDLLRFPSISADPSYAEDVKRCAEWVKDEMERIGLNNCRTMPTAGHPVVYGEWLEAGEDAPTVLVYAHYDVQPIDPLELWESAPFEPEIRAGKLYARGVTDDKCGVWLNMKAIESMLATDGRLPVNVKLFFEGEEESGSPSMEPFIQANKDSLQADVLVLSDGPFNVDNPQVFYALRGGVGATVTLTGPDHDLHSGSYGGVVQNPVHQLGKIIASFHDDTGRIQIAGFNEPVRELETAERDYMEEVFAAERETYVAKAGIDHLWAEAQGTIAERGTARPTLDINGVWGGYQGPGIKTIIPSQAGFCVTMRLVADQKPHEIAAAFREHVMAFETNTCKIDIEMEMEAWPLTMEFDGPAVEAVQRAMERVISKRAVMRRGGGSIPIGGMFQQALGMTMTGLGLGPGANEHSPNEYVDVEQLYQALDVAIHFYYALAETMGSEA